MKKCLTDHSCSKIWRTEGNSQCHQMRGLKFSCSMNNECMYKKDITVGSKRKYTRKTLLMKQSYNKQEGKIKSCQAHHITVRLTSKMFALSSNLPHTIYQISLSSAIFSANRTSCYMEKHFRSFFKINTMFMLQKSTVLSMLHIKYDYWHLGHNMQSNNHNIFIAAAV